MKFVATRTSRYNGKPCEEAYEGTLIYVDTRSVSDPKQLMARYDRETWYEKGTNHRLIGGNIARDLGVRPVWFVDINTLEELIEFRNKHGELVITTSIIDNQSCEIEIYDDYRE